MSMKRVFEFWGTFLIPGHPERAKADLPPTKVVADTPQAASRDLQPILIETFKKELPYKFSFSRDFALLHLQWKVLPVIQSKVKAEPIVEVIHPIHNEAVEVSTEPAESTMGS